MRRLLFIFFVGLVGCGKSMTNDEIITETHKCESAGLVACVQFNGFTGNVRGIVCYPKENKR